MCNSDYHADLGLRIHLADESSVSLPALALHTQEIHLFIELYELTVPMNFALFSDRGKTVVIESDYTTEASSVFHPPSLG